MKLLAFFSIFSILTLTGAYAGEVPQLRCFGTEPFWGTEIDAKGFLSYSDPIMDTKKFYSKTTLKNAHGTSADFAFQIVAQDMAKKTLKLNVVKQSCNDGMSDEIYPYTTLVDIEGEILFGCCDK